MTESSFLRKEKTASSNRVGEHWMDGKPLLMSHPSKYTKPWDDCITASEITKDNLPPFYVRLRNDQVGHLAYRIKSQRGILNKPQLGAYWPFDFDATGNIDPLRCSWGSGYTGPSAPGTEKLGPGLTKPEYEDPDLPLSYTSNHKIMFEGTSSLTHKQLQDQLLNLAPTLQMKKMVSSGRGPVVNASGKIKTEEAAVLPPAPEIANAVKTMETLLASFKSTSKKLSETEAQLGFEKAKNEKAIKSLSNENSTKQTAAKDQVSSLTVQLEKARKEIKNLTEQIQNESRLKLAQKRLAEKEEELMQARKEAESIKDVLTKAIGGFSGIGLKAEKVEKEVKPVIVRTSPTGGIAKPVSSFRKSVNKE